MIEVYPKRATLDIPDRGDRVVFAENPTRRKNWLFQISLSVPLELPRLRR
jgi:hypothetical protein